MLHFSPREAAWADGLELPGRWPVGGAARSRLDAALTDYLEVGGFPAARSLHPYDRVQQLQEYVDLVVLRDVAERHGVTNLQALRALVTALFAANAGGFSVSRLHGALAVDDPVEGGPPQLVQVCWSLMERGTRERELRALTEAMAKTGCTEGTVVTLVDEEELDTAEGRVRILPARRFFFGPEAGPRR